jgi:hypothetical protein
MPRTKPRKLPQYLPSLTSVPTSGPLQSHESSPATRQQHNQLSGDSALDTTPSLPTKPYQEDSHRSAYGEYQQENVSGRSFKDELSATEPEDLNINLQRHAQVLSLPTNDTEILGIENSSDPTMFPAATARLEDTDHGYVEPPQATRRSFEICFDFSLQKADGSFRSCRVKIDPSSELSTINGSAVDPHGIYPWPPSGGRQYPLGSRTLTLTEHTKLDMESATLGYPRTTLKLMVLRDAHEDPLAEVCLGRRAILRHWKNVSWSRFLKELPRFCGHTILEVIYMNLSPEAVLQQQGMSNRAKIRIFD